MVATNETPANQKRAFPKWKTYKADRPKTFTEGRENVIFVFFLERY